MNTGKYMHPSEEYIDTALQAALEAGRKILKVYEGDDFGVEKKIDDSPLTRADRLAHDTITRHLEATGLPVLSEEGADIPFEKRRLWGLYWLVDPLDGTKEFIKRNGEFTVNIALMRPVDPDEDILGSHACGSHIPEAGVIYIPVPDILYIGIVGSGAWKAENASAEHITTVRNIRALGTALPIYSRNDRPFTAIVSRTHNTPESEELLSRLETQYGPVKRITSGSSIKFCLMAEGAADIYPRFAPTMEWDTAAGEAICRAVGCRVIDKDGLTPLTYNKQNLLNPWFLVMGCSIYMY